MIVCLRNLRFFILPLILKFLQSRRAINSLYYTLWEFIFNKCHCSYIHTHIHTQTIEKADVPDAHHLSNLVFTKSRKKYQRYYSLLRSCTKRETLYIPISIVSYYTLFLSQLRINHERLKREFVRDIIES